MTENHLIDNSIFNFFTYAGQKPEPEIIAKTGGAEWYNDYLYDHYGFTTVYNDIALVAKMVEDAMIKNEYKYNRLYNTITAQYGLTDPLTRKTIETHSGVDATTEDGTQTDTPTGTIREIHASASPTETDNYSTKFDSAAPSLTGRSQTTYSNYDETSFNKFRTDRTDNKNKRFTHGHEVVTTHEYEREPQEEIEAERRVALFSLQMTIINDILDSIAIPVYINYSPEYDQY